MEQEESRWRVKVELSQGELKEVCVQIKPETKSIYIIALFALFIEPFELFFFSVTLDEPESRHSGARD